jgi:hypothetical protein
LAFEREDEEGSRGFLRNVSVFQFSFSSTRNILVVIVYDLGFGA